MKLTDPIIKAAKPRDKKYSLPDGKGLSLWVIPTGAKWWRYRYYYQGKEKMLSLGVYPDKSLKQARTEHMALRELLPDIDPSINRQEKKQQTLVAKENSFESVASQWWDHWQHDKKKKHAHDVIRRFEAYVFPVIGFTPINDLTAQSIAMTVKRIGSPDIAKRALNN